MRKYQIFLSYYSLIVPNFLFAWSLFLSPDRRNFLLALLIVPISLYFWLVIAGFFKPKTPPGSSTEETNERWPIRVPLIILATLFVSSFSIFFYSTITNRQKSLESVTSLVPKEIENLGQEIEKANQQNKESYDQLTQKITRIENWLARESEQNGGKEPSVMNESGSQFGTLTIKDSTYQTVNVYQEKSTSSKVIGKAEFGKTYPFLEKDNAWYQILLEEELGFISSLFVKEVEN